MKKEKKELTNLENNIFNYILKYWQENGFSPSIADISKACYISRTATHKYIFRLYEKNYISFVPKIARSITIKEQM